MQGIRWQMFLQAAHAIEYLRLCCLSGQSYTGLLKVSITEDCGVFLLYITDRNFLINVYTCFDFRNWDVDATSNKPVLQINNQSPFRYKSRNFVCCGNSSAVSIFELISDGNGDQGRDFYILLKLVNSFFRICKTNYERWWSPVSGQLVWPWY